MDKIKTSLGHVRRNIRNKQTLPKWFNKLELDDD